jgi:hypothetical protein
VVSSLSPSLSLSLSLSLTHSPWLGLLQALRSWNQGQKTALKTAMLLTIRTRLHILSLQEIKSNSSVPPLLYSPPLPPSLPLSSPSSLLFTLPLLSSLLSYLLPLLKMIPKWRISAAATKPKRTCPARRRGPPAQGPTRRCAREQRRGGGERSGWEGRGWS